MVFKKIIFQNSLMANETPSRPPPLHGKCHLKFPFWLSAHFPNSSYRIWWYFIVQSLIKQKASFIHKLKTILKNKTQVLFNALGHVSGSPRKVYWVSQIIFYQFQIPIIIEYLRCQLTQWPRLQSCLLPNAYDHWPRGAKGSKLSA